MSKACCTVPAVVVDDYTPKGTYTTLEGMKVYITGPTNAKSAILFLYDAFGYSPQGLQGADILASTTSHLILMPDYLPTDCLSLSDVPPDTPEKQAAIQRFMTGAGDIPSKVPLLRAHGHAIRSLYPSVQKLGVVGFCWGAKIVTLAAGGEDGKVFTASAQVHPAALSEADAEKLSGPQLLLASPDEDAAEVGKVKAVLEGRGDGVSAAETYEGMYHGWMGARAKLGEEKIRKEYERGYAQLAAWFAKVLA